MGFKSPTLAQIVKDCEICDTSRVGRISGKNVATYSSSSIQEERY